MALRGSGLSTSAGTSDGDGVGVIEDVDIDLRYEEVIGVVGESGAGKTLTMMGLLVLLPAGVVARGVLTLQRDRRFDLSSVRQMREVRGKGIGIVLQN